MMVVTEDDGWRWLIDYMMMMSDDRLNDNKNDGGNKKITII